jgi:hypothetical protein
VDRFYAELEKGPPAMSSKLVTKGFFSSLALTMLLSSSCQFQDVQQFDASAAFEHDLPNRGQEVISCARVHLTRRSAQLTSP